MSDSNASTPAPVAAPAVQADAVVAKVHVVAPPTPQTPVAAAVAAPATPKASSAASSFLDEDDGEDGQESAVDLSADTEAHLEAVFGSDAGSDDGDSESGDDTVVVEGTEQSGLDTIGAADLDNLLGDEDSNAIVEVCKKKCLECKALVPWAEKIFKQCHFSAGNEFCPAKSIQIRTRIPFEEILPRFFAAEERNDNKFMLKFYENLSKREQWQQDAIQDAIKQERDRRRAA